MQLTHQIESSCKVSNRWNNAGRRIEFRLRNKCDEQRGGSRCKSHLKISRTARAQPRKECNVRETDELLRQDLRLRALFDDAIVTNRINRHHFDGLLNDPTVCLLFFRGRLLRLLLVFVVASEGRFAAYRSATGIPHSPNSSLSRQRPAAS